MPRDLSSIMQNDSNNQEPKDKISRDMDKQDQIAEIKPYAQSLTVSDVDSSLALEDAAFPPNERATKEKFEYRFTKCGELCLGLFTSVDTNSDSSAAASAPTVSTAHPVYSGAPHRKLVLLAHCVVTKTTNDTILDADMEVPKDWRSSSTLDTDVGHKELGRTVAVHSLAVLPALQGRGLGATLLKAFINRLEHSQAADRVVLLAHDSLVQFYEKFGFQNKGPSKATFGGGGWVDMVLELKKGE